MDFESTYQLTDTIRFLNTSGDRSHFRNLLFHQLNVASKRQLNLLSNILGLTLNDPNAAFGKIAVRITGLNTPAPLGNPLADLRKLKRSPLIKKKSVGELFVYKKEDLEECALMIPDLTEDGARCRSIPSKAQAM